MTRKMSQGRDIAANDNAPLRVAVEDIASTADGSHVYVGNHAAPKAVSSVQPPKAKVVERSCRMVIATDLPECLPILDTEIALIRGYMAELVSRILANDNDPT